MIHSGENLISLIVTPIPGDQSKRYLFTAGSGKTIHMFKVDTVLKCASMPMFTLETSHENTISSMIFYRMPDNKFQLATASIDKKVGLFEIWLPEA